MRGLFVVLLALAAGPAMAADCVRDGAEALAKAQGVALKDLPGINSETDVSIKLNGTKVVEASILRSSGNAALDEVLRQCRAAQTYWTDGTQAFTAGFRWKYLLDPPLPELASSPRSVGAPHICLSNYPIDAVKEGRVGKTGILFDITAEGKVAALMIYASSGSKDLDLATTQCAAHWLYEPARNAASAAVSTPWSAYVTWTLDNKTVPGVPRVFRSASCVGRFPDAAERAKAAKSGAASVRYTLKDGVVTAAEMAPQTGDPVLDGYALSCVKQWSFRGDLDNNSPATGSFVAVIDWAPPTAP